jgi:DNA-binding transcriptional LysR family regulator
MKSIPHAQLETFVAIAQNGSLRRAAEILGLQPPAVSYQLKSLESWIGTPLFIRTTRSVTLTDAGRSLLARAQPALSELAGAVEDARDTGGAQKGSVHITLPFSAHQVILAPHLAAFAAAYPQIELELSFSEAFVDIAAEGFHAGVRMGDLIGEDMIAVRLTPPTRQVVFASPEYLRRHGRPQVPADLLDHNCIRYRYIASGRIADWQFQMPEGTTTVDVRGSLIVNSTVAVIGAARNGIGLSWLVGPDIEDEINQGHLESVLDPFALERAGYFLYFPRANANIRVVRTFIDFMRERARLAGSDAKSTTKIAAT